MTPADILRVVRSVHAVAEDATLDIDDRIAALREALAPLVRAYDYATLLHWW